MSEFIYSDDNESLGIAIVGMACRLPDARNIDEFWHNLRDGVCSIHPFTVDELKASGVDEKTLQDPNFVNAGTVMPDADSFDASFFGISKREAEIMDPQHRVFLETAWEALENAGYCPDNFQGKIGVFGGVGQNTYLQKNLITRPDLLQTLGSYSFMLASEKEYAVTRVSFKLNLKGPSIGINTACSTSAVAIHLACQSLLSGECDMALAGGAKISVPLKAGYLYEEGGIRSPDGKCRAFDADARGTVVGNGAGVVVLKRLSDAINDSDSVYAVIKGSAINNDGSQKVGFTAPSIQGQASAIEEALTLAEASADSIGYVEAHGTGTSLGDPIEIAALTQAFRNAGATKSDYCPIGSVKTNIGHLDAAAGIAGVIKVALMLKNKMIPPSLNFNHPNPQIDFANSPFYVNTELREWKTDSVKRMAGVSSFGLGGTNAHIVMEEAPLLKSANPSRSKHLLLISTKSASALEQATTNLAKHLRQNQHLNIADVAYTLQTGRRAFNHRRMIISSQLNDAIAVLESRDQKRILTSTQEPMDRDVVFMFSGQGSQYVNMGLELYQSEPVFKQAIDRCAEILASKLPVDLCHILYPNTTGLEEAARLLDQTSYTQPALFTIEYALAMLWMSWGIKPSSMIGHSIGEYVAACLAGVFSLEDALKLVVARGMLMQEMSPGSMLAVPMEEQRLKSYLNGGLSVSVFDSPSLHIVSGEQNEIKALEDRLTANGIECQRLHTSHAFHSKMMDPMLRPFLKEVEKIKLNQPRIPFVSNLTGTWITPSDATDSNYWAQQLRQPVRLRESFEELLKKTDSIFLEVGPGRTLSASARRNFEAGSKTLVFSSTRHPNEDASDLTFILTMLGRLWLAGLQIDWTDFYSNEKRQRVSLPTYPFERKRYWVNPRNTTYSASMVITEPEAIENTDTGFQDTVSQANAPRTEVEKSLAEIWEELLGIDNLSIHDNFFELGGSSLLATRLLTRIASVYGKKLPMSTIFESPTIEKLSGLLDQQVAAPKSRRRSSLVKIQEGRSSRPPFYCVPGNLGNVFVDFEYLYRHLGSDQTFYGFQDGLGNPSKIETLAARYIEDIRRIQPDGPYLLGGVCFGGPVAFEMAQQLRQQGQQVSFLALIEPATLPLPGMNSYRDLFDDIWKRFTRTHDSTGRNIKM
ncbi:MAG TPA: beta-ketoacyl synthase N-terminal-like domain-containing protein, partial [Anaerolineales bacterium]